MTGFHVDFDDLLSDLFGLYELTENLILQGKYRNLDAYVRGWYLHVHHGCESILTLSSRGLQFETAPLRRSVIEHTLTLKWVRYDGEPAIDVLGRAGVHSMQRIEQAKKNAGFDLMAVEDLEALQRVADAVDKSNDRYANFAPRAEKLGGNVEMVSFLQETMFSHPSLPGAMMFFEPTKGFDRFDQAYFCSYWLLYALVHLNEMFSPTPWPGLFKLMEPRLVQAAATAAL